MKGQLGGDGQFPQCPVDGRAQRPRASPKAASPRPAEFTDLIELSVGREGERTTVAGTFFGKQPRIVRIAGKRMEVVPEGHLLLLENKDMPGMVGAYGTLLGKHGVNIAHMSLSRDTKDGTALVVLTLDAPPSDLVLSEIRKLPNVTSVRVLSL